jgi:hypothetical protein
MVPSLTAPLLVTLPHYQYRCGAYGLCGGEGQDQFLTDRGLKPPPAEGQLLPSGQAGGVGVGSGYVQKLVTIPLAAWPQDGASAALTAGPRALLLPSRSRPQGGPGGASGRRQRRRYSKPRG